MIINEGNQNERALRTVLHIGSAVIYGGTSTILSLAVLFHSKAYTYRAFFRIFFFVVMYGLFNGVVFLPVVLSIVGPKSYKTRKAQEEQNCENTTSMENISFIVKPSNLSP